VENSAENFPPKMLGINGIFRGKSFEKLFSQAIPQNFPGKITFRGKKMYEKLAPGADFFGGKFQGKFRGKFSPKNVRNKWNFPPKKF
jgi:hypothetical protein